MSEHLLAGSAPITRVLPGRATQRNQFTAQIQYYRAVVESVSEFIIVIRPEGKLIGLQRLVGETYIYVCTKCTCRIDGKRQPTTVFQYEHTKSHGGCPFCGSQLRYVKPGETLRIHFRTNIPKVITGPLEDHHGAAWWGEVFVF